MVNPAVSSNIRDQNPDPDTFLSTEMIALICACIVVGSMIVIGFVYKVTIMIRAKNREVDDNEMEIKNKEDCSTVLEVKNEENDSVLEVAKEENDTVMEVNNKENGSVLENNIKNISRQFSLD